MKKASEPVHQLIQKHNHVKMFSRWNGVVCVALCFYLPCYFSLDISNLYNLIWFLQENFALQFVYLPASMQVPNIAVICCFVKFSYGSCFKLFRVIIPPSPLQFIGRFLPLIFKLPITRVQGNFHPTIAACRTGNCYARRADSLCSPIDSCDRHPTSSVIKAAWWLHLYLMRAFCL